MSADQYRVEKPSGPMLCPECGTVDGHDVFVVLDEDGLPDITFPTKEQCHEHINEAVYCDIEGAKKWVVRQYRQVFNGTDNTSRDSHE